PLAAYQDQAPHQEENAHVRLRVQAKSGGAPFLLYRLSLYFRPHALAKSPLAVSLQAKEPERPSQPVQSARLAQATEQDGVSGEPGRSCGRSDFPSEIDGSAGLYNK